MANFACQRYVFCRQYLNVLFRGYNSQFHRLIFPSNRKMSGIRLALRNTLPSIDDGRLTLWAQTLEEQGIHDAGDVAHLDASTFEELCEVPKVKAFGLPLKAALRKLRESGSSSANSPNVSQTLFEGQGFSGGGIGIAHSASKMAKHQANQSQGQLPGLTTAAAGSVGSIAKAGFEKGYDALGDEGKDKLAGAAKGAVGKAIGGAAMGGLGSVANELLACNTILQATLGVVNEIRRMYAQAKANREKCEVLARHVESLELPLLEVGKLVDSNRVAPQRAGAVSQELDATQKCVAEAKIVIVTYVEIRDKKGFFVRVKEVLISGHMDEQFEKVGSGVHNAYDKLHKLLTLLAAVDNLTRLPNNSPPDFKQASKKDLHSLELDLTQIAGGQAKLDTELRAVGWKVDDMQRVVRGHLDRIESLLNVVDQKMDEQSIMLRAIIEMIKRDKANELGALASIQKGFANPAAACFWEQRIEGLARSNGVVLWADFSAATFNALTPLGIDKESWLAIEPTVRSRFDANRDGTISWDEYNRATSEPHPVTIIELCQQLLLQVVKQASSIASPAPRTTTSATTHRTMLLSNEVVQRALAEERARVGPRYLPMTRLHAALVAQLDFAGDAKARYAFMSVPRRLFAPEPLPVGISEAEVYENRPIKYGFWHQSQPLIYLEALKHMRINDDLGEFSFLCIGSGSGYFNALVAVMQNWKGKNCGIELRQSMVALARARLDTFCQQINVVSNVVLQSGNAFLSLDARAGKFDRIYVASAVDQSDLPLLLSLLNDDGIMLAPVNVSGGQALIAFEKHVGGNVKQTKVAAVRYVSAVKSVSHAHRLVAVQPPSGNWVCSNCKIDFDGTEKRFRCSQGCDFNYCNDCYAAAANPATVKWN